MSMYGKEYKFDTVNWMEVAKANGVEDFTVEDAEAMYAIAGQEVSFGNPKKEWDRRTNRFTAYDDGRGIATIGVGHRIKKGEKLENISWPEGIDLFMKDYVDHREQAKDLMGAWEGTPRWQIMSPAQRYWLVDKVFNVGKTGLAMYVNSVQALLGGDVDRVMESKVKGGKLGVINRGQNANNLYYEMWTSMSKEDRKNSILSPESIEGWRKETWNIREAERRRRAGK